MESMKKPPSDYILLKKSSSCRPKLPSSAIFKVVQILQVGDAKQLERSDKLPSGVLRHNDAIAEMDTKNLRFTQPTNMTPTKHAEGLWHKALRCSIAYNEYIMIGIFIEGLHRLIQRNMLLYWRSRKKTTVHPLARYTTSLTNLQYGL